MRFPTRKVPGQNNESSLSLLVFRNVYCCYLIVLACTSSIDGNEENGSRQSSVMSHCYKDSLRDL